MLQILRHYLTKEGRVRVKLGAAGISCFCVADFATLSDERRSCSKIVLLFNMDKRTLRSKLYRAHTFERSWDFAN